MFDSINFLIGSLLSNPATAFLAGMLAIITPCTIAIIPLVFYRFGVWQSNSKYKWQPVLIFLTCFLLSFLVTGLAVEALASSVLNNAFRMVVASLLIIGGVLALFKKLNLQNNTQFNSPVSFGLVLPWVVSVSPCVIPFITGLLAASNNGAIRFLAFGLGMIVPVIIFALIGKKLIQITQKGAKGFMFLERLSPALLILAGVLMLLSLVVITRVDLVVWFGAMILIAALLTFNRLKANFTLSNLQILVLAFSLVSTISALGYSIIDPKLVPMSGKAYLLKCNTWYLGSADSVAVTTTVVTASLIIAFAYVLSFKNSQKLKLVLKR